MNTVAGFQRISRDAMLMEMVSVVKKRSSCLRRQVGALLSLDGRVLSTGYNGAPSGMAHCTPATCNADRPCIDTIHAESNAIAFAARYGIRTEGSTLYTTASPCRDCAKLIINAGICCVVFDEFYRDTDPLRFLQRAKVNVGRWKNGIIWDPFHPNAQKP